MNDIKAKPIVDGKFWIVERNGDRIGTLQKKENNRFMLSSNHGKSFFGKKEELIKAFGKDFFKSNIKPPTNEESIVREVYGFPTSCDPYNAFYDLKRKLPLFTKSLESKSVYCAGYYIIKFDKGWLKSFCPKLITIERYENQGPFKTEIEMKKVLSNAKSN